MRAPGAGPYAFNFGGAEDVDGPGTSPAMAIRWMCGYRFTHDPRIAPDSVNEI
jgi:hypothetical protein